MPLFISGASMNSACSLALALLSVVVDNSWFNWSAPYVGTPIIDVVLRKFEDSSL